MELINKPGIRRCAVAAMLTLTSTLWLSGCDAHGEEETAQQQPAPPSVEVAEVVSSDVTLWDDFSGRVVAPETVALRPRVSGYIDSVSFEEGEMVAKGDVLFSIDPRPYKARERVAEANLAQARSHLELAQSEAKRAERLVKGRAISQEEYDQRASALASARAAVGSARATLDTARLDLEYTQVKSPIAGRAGRAGVTRGNLASADNTILTSIVSVDPLYVYFESNEETFLGGRKLLQNDQGPRVEVGLAGESGYTHPGMVDFIDNQLNANTGTLQYRAVLPNPEGVLKPGQFARVRMPTSNLNQALLVDQKAVVTDQDRRFVYVVKADNTIDRRQVVPGGRADGLMVIADGLAAGDRVVVSGLHKIFGAGMPVTPQPVDMQRKEVTGSVAIIP